MLLAVSKKQAATMPTPAEVGDGLGEAGGAEAELTTHGVEVGDVGVGEALAVELAERGVFSPLERCPNEGANDEVG